MVLDYQINNKIDTAKLKINDAAQRQMKKAVINVQNVAKKTLSGQRTGRRYKVPGTNKWYIASAPGEPPAKRTGALQKNVKYSVVRDYKSISGYVGTDLDYGRELEEERDRPWLRPSFENSRAMILRILGKKWID